jgi:hypothetical protein
MSPPSAPARSSLPAPRRAPAAAPGPRLTPLLAPEERLAADAAAALEAAGAGPVTWSCEGEGEGCQVYVTLCFAPAAADAALHVLDAVARRHRAAVARASAAGGAASATLLLALPPTPW